MKIRISQPYKIVDISMMHKVFDAGHYEALLRQGLDFFEVARFNAVPERWWRGGGGCGGTACGSFGIPSRYASPGNDGNNTTPEAYQENLSQTADSVLQCYRCQGFWHVAANCRHLPRCVRCGEPHSVEFCPRPRNNPICCHCSGPHHAGKSSLSRILASFLLHVFH
ncbi:PREDICTED: CCHC-type zinc finger protein CG3800-like [Wasmannia auropunctata]|uniref:CCHC-type zinc finger protein CG3800-like n=1 Tax=Wasmannia auropunctata TaxID=64793 RepID=UPI0005EDE455|nr:PREDICTED: CCHC-type zinc finger protein CG3800-like [Wasmannia auropunctata]